MLLNPDMSKKTISPSQGPVRGGLTVPGDKSISHRSIMIGALADGPTEISGFLKSADCISTMNCFRALGVEVEEKNGIITVRGKGPKGLERPDGVLDVGNSGTTMRLLSGILAAQDFECELTGDASIRRRPMNRVIEPLRAMGAGIESLGGGGLAPLRITGRKLKSIDWISPVASAQVKSCIILAGLCSGVSVTVSEPTLSRDHTERMLAAFGVDVRTGRNSDGSFTVSCEPRSLKTPGKIDVPGDISSAAYFLAIPAMINDSAVTVRNVGINPTRDGFLRVLEMMGIGVERSGIKNGSEPSADLTAVHPGSGELSEHYRDDVVIGGSLIPTLIDELPMVAAMACVMPGRTIIKDASELRVKESDRIEAMTSELTKMGADIQATPDGFIINGVERLHGAEVDSHDDHRVAMSLAVAALSADGDTVINSPDCVRISYPSFFDDLNSLI